MTLINLPSTIANGDVPDWDAVQSYFDAIVAAAETTGWDDDNIKPAAGIAYSKLDLAGAIANADLAGSITVSKFARPTVSTATSSGVSITPISTWKDVCTITPSASGLYLFCASGGITNSYDSSSYDDRYIVRLYNNTAASQIGGAVPVGSHIVSGEGGAQYSFSVVGLQAITAADSIRLQVQSSANANATVDSNRATLQGVQISA